ncbi:MAG: hypothetical protein RQ751_03290 [Longimicrobiales bacterium]|nr:hypothetical protein [Longimicrobiales bacterium]
MRALAVRAAAVLAAGAVLPSGTNAQDVNSREEFRWSGTVARGGVVEIKGINGAISATGATGDQVEVLAVKSGRRNDPAEVRIEVVEHGGGVTLCAVYPHGSGDEANRCEPGDAGRLHARHNDVAVRWEVRVPRGLRFRGRTVNGEMAATGLTGSVDLATVNGDVAISTTAFATARTVNGSIEARMSGPPEGDASFETVNGSIALDVADDTGARVDASWLNGGLETALPFAVRGGIGRRSARGVLGAGGPTLTLRTVNGSIRIH